MVATVDTTRVAALAAELAKLCSRCQDLQQEIGTLTQPVPDHFLVELVQRPRCCALPLVIQLHAILATACESPVSNPEQ